MVYPARRQFRKILKLEKAGNALEGSGTSRMKLFKLRERWAVAVGRIMLGWIVRWCCGALGPAWELAGECIVPLNLNPDTPPRVEDK